MKGQFKDLTELNAFIEPLKTIGLIVGESGFNIDFSKNEDGVIEAVIPARNKTRGVIIIHKWKTLFENFEFDEDSIKIGFMKIQDLIGRLSLFDNEPLDVEMNSDGILSFTQKKLKLEFKTSDPELIVDGKRNFKGSDWVGEFVMGDDTDKIKSALKVMNSEEFISFMGIEEKGKINVAISNHGLKTNSFKYSINAKVNEDFDITFKKELFPVILSTKSVSEISCNISKKMINMSLNTDYCETDYFIAKAIIRD